MYKQLFDNMSKREGSQEDKVDAKQEEDNSFFKSCQKCTKFFTNQTVYETHLKMKHCEKVSDKESEEEEQEEEPEEEPQEEEEPPKQQKAAEQKKSQKSIPFKNRMLEMQRNQLEDNIYTFLGELGEKNAEPASNRSQFIFQSQNQKLTGQTNYSVNKVIRTPYEESIKCSEEIPSSEIEKSKHKDFLIELKKQLIILQEKVEAERQVWELRDPMAPEEETQDQFSLMDIRKLIHNYPKRKINLKYPHFSIYLLWVGRICKSPAFKEFFMLMGDYLAHFYDIEANKSKGDGTYDNWVSFHKQYENKKVELEHVQQLKIFDEKSSKKYIEYYVQWVSLFKALTI